MHNRGVKRYEKLMNTTVGQIIKRIEELAPVDLAEKWDNCGLQAGDPGWPVKKIMTALDPSPGVLEKARREGIDLVVTHHPLIFKPLRKIHFGSVIGRAISISARHKIAIYSAHTNLDSTINGVNDILAEKIGLTDLSVLGSPAFAKKVKLVVYVPVSHEKQILDAVFKTPAGQIGPYSCCTYRNKGVGTFFPEKDSDPFAGKKEDLSEVEELRVETVVSEKDINGVIEKIRSVHPYETMAYDIYPLTDQPTGQGIGRIGMLESPKPLGAFAVDVKKRLGLDAIKIAGDPELMIEKAALCSGSGSSMLDRFYASDAKVYISGDLKYHDAMDAVQKGLALMDVGHFSSEVPVVQALAKRLGNMLEEGGIKVSVIACDMESDPFKTL